MPTHANGSACQKCTDIIDRYPGLHSDLESWFTGLKAGCEIVHCSAAGRGRFDQELFFQRGASKAHYQDSAHNYNAAIDLFFLIEGKASWDKALFEKFVAPKLSPNLNWYGAPGSKFYELPHIEIRDWKELARQNSIKLVEP